MPTFFDWKSKGSGVLFNIPHAAVEFVRIKGKPDFALSDDDLLHSCLVLADFGIDEVFKKLNEESQYSFIRSNVSRMWVDVERFDDASEEMNKSGMGVIYTKNEELKDIYVDELPEHVCEERKNFLYRPYHERLNELASTHMEKAGSCTIIDLHSYASERLPYELHGSDRRPEICLGWNGDIQSLGLCQRLREGFEKLHYDVGVNETFVGSIVPNRFLRAQPDNLSSIMIEVRKDLYLNERTMFPSGGQSFVKDFRKVLSEALD